MAASEDQPHIVVLGAGFGGLTFCQKYRGPGRITLIDRTNHHLFQPLLYQVAMSGLAAPDIAAPIRAVLAKKSNVTVLMDNVRGIDLAGKSVQLCDRQLDYDYLVIGLGGRVSWFGHDHWAEHAPGLKTIDDALRMRRQVLSSYELAESIDDPEERRKLTTIVVVGGGPTGVELAGAMVELARRVFRKDFRRIDPTQSRVILVEGGPRVLDMFPDPLPEKGAEQLRELGVEVRLNSMVADVTAEGVTLADGAFIPSRNVLWGAGVTANPVVADLPVEHGPGGRVTVNTDLAIPDHPEAFVVGDAAHAIDADGRPVPGLAPAAMQMGKFTARLIAKELKTAAPAADDRAAERPVFRYFDKGIMSTIGRRRAVAAVGPLRFTGLIAWIAWLIVHLIFLVSFRNRVRVLLEWAYAYLTFRRGARIIFGGVNCRRGDNAAASSD